MTSSNGNIFRVTGHLCGEFTGHKGQWRGALVFFLDLRPNNRLSKQSWGWWLETLSRPLWRHCNVSETTSNNMGKFETGINKNWYYNHDKINIYVQLRYLLYVIAKPQCAWWSHLSWTTVFPLQFNHRLRVKYNRTFDTIIIIQNVRLCITINSVFIGIVW